MGSGSAKLYMPTNRLPVCRSGTVATRSEARAKASAAEKPPTTVAISRRSVAQRPTGLVELEQEAQADSRCFFSKTRARSLAPKFSTKPSLARNVNVRPSLFKLELVGRAQDRFSAMDELIDAIAKPHRTG